MMNEQQVALAIQVAIMNGKSTEFQVGGTPPILVVTAGPELARITVPVKWPLSHIPEESEKVEVMGKANWTIKYLANQGLIQPVGCQVLVQTNHPTK